MKSAIQIYNEKTLKASNITILIIGIAFLIISLILYFTKGQSYGSITIEFMIHLYWSLITAFIGIGLIISHIILHFYLITIKEG